VRFPSKFPLQPAAESLQRRYGDATVIDVTSRGPQPWIRFSPFYPHGGIPVLCSPEQTGASVEGIWQGLKVFARQDVDPSKLANTTMHGLKRSTRQLGAVLGHRAGLQGDRLLTYVPSHPLTGDAKQIASGVARENLRGEVSAVKIARGLAGDDHHAPAARRRGGSR